ncbi:methyl-accepting chemotaxis protein [Sphingomonas kyungheensis]|uniref:Methyl-accepting chemotaxis protein n=1 Tax=Sphingomonas kyungheensis TaxID=1069987 RepID=A0ABU8GXA0_9SPHN
MLPSYSDLQKPFFIKRFDWLHGSVTARLMAPLVGAIALLWVLALVTLHAAHNVNAATAAVVTAQDRVWALSEIRSLSRSLQRDALNLITEDDPAERETVTGKIRTRSRAMRSELGKLEHLANRGDLPGAYFTDSYRVVRALLTVAAHASGGDRAGALHHFQHVVRPAERFASKVADHQIDLLRARVAALESIKTATESAALFTFLCAVIILTAGGLVAGLLITRQSVILPLQVLRASMYGLAAGADRLVIPHLNRADEIGQMAHSLAELRDQLRIADESKRQQAQQIVDGIGRSLDALAHGDLTTRVEGDVAGEFAKLKVDCNNALVALAATLSLLHGSAREIVGQAGAILDASHDLAGRTEQQNAALKHTAAAMHQITQTVRDTAHSAKLADAMVTQAHDDATQLDLTVRQMIAAMDAIDRSSAEITEIISVIDGFAFQTSLLALNAGIEAARAGEAGRGFAVVASEVRALAQRSAEAAQDVKGRITVSIGQVDSGMALVGEAGRGLDRIRTTMVRAVDLVAAITRANGEQAVGLGEVNDAVGQMDAMTQSNAAMVAEVTSATTSLHVVTRQMTDQIARFRLDDQVCPAARAYIS